MENLETVRVKWFVPVASGESFRLPARILPPVHTETECDIISKLYVLINFLLIFFFRNFKTTRSGRGRCRSKEEYYNTSEARSVWYQQKDSRTIE